MSLAATLLLLAPDRASANSSSASQAQTDGVVREVAVQEIVTREISQTVVVKEIAPPEIARQKAARKESLRQQLARIAEVSAEIPDLSIFLDRLMMAESGGRDTAANPLSTALGPFQFIKSTFLDIARRHFPEHYTDLNDEQVLALRTTRYFARSAAAAYTLENAAYLKAQGHEPSWPHLRLAFLLGPAGASRVLQAPQDTPLSQLLSSSVLQANPFMARMTVTDLVARAARDIASEKSTGAAAGTDGVTRPEARARPAARTRPGSQDNSGKAEATATASIRIRCNQKLISCQRWVTLQKIKMRKRNAGNGQSPSVTGGKG